MNSWQISLFIITISLKQLYFTNISSNDQQTTELFSSKSELLKSEHKSIYFVDFDIFVNDFLNYEPKNGLLEMDLSVKFKWWENNSKIEEDIETIIRKRNQYSKSQNLKIKNFYSNSFYPAFKFTDKQTKLLVRNSVHRIDNLEEILEPFELSKQFKKAQPRTKSDHFKRYYRQYSSLEQDLILKFNCINETEKFDNFFNIFSSDSMEKFPFDSHECSLNFDIIPKQVFANTFLRVAKKRQTPIYLFQANKQTDYIIDYNKLVQSSSNHSLISREWLLKKISIGYANTSQREVQDYTSNMIVKFHIFRRREPQLYIFIIPLSILTLVTFLVFFLPTSKTSEKCLIAFLNLIVLLAFNLYLFKLIVYIYELVRIPLILQYSNCLMLIQLGVFVYTCLSKSMYITINNTLFINDAETTYKQILSMNSNKTIDSLFQFCSNSNHSNLTKTHSNYHRYDVSRHSNQDTFKLKMPVIKLNTNENNLFLNDESNMFVPFHSVESSVGTARHLICDCSSMETETDDLTDCHNSIFSDKKLDHDQLFSIPADGDWIKFSKDGKNLKSVKKNNLYESTMCNHRKEENCNQKVPDKDKQIYFINDRYSSCDSNLKSAASKPSHLYVKKQEKSAQPIVIRSQLNGNECSSSLNEITKLNLNVKKLVKMEELNLKERLIKNEWTKKARFCDAICFLLSFFLLLVCSLLIFVVFPSEYFRLTKFFPNNDE